MKSSLKIALLLGAVSVVAGVGNAQVLDRDSQRTERSADRLLREFDFNRDGRVTRDEMNRTIGWRFAQATHRAADMTYEQFLGARADVFRPRNVETFRGADWNGDGKLVLAEFAAGPRGRFISLDSTGQGYVSCAVVGRNGWRGGLSSFCTDYDTNMDGRVTRPELDSAVAKRFSAVTGGAGTMTAAQFDLSEQQRYAVSNARAFRRLDVDGDGVLTVQEFGASELKMFARMDKNSDGTLAANEIHPRTIARADRKRRTYN